MQGVPDRLPGWEDNFVLPKQFSKSIMEALASGLPLPDNARSFIVRDVAGRMLNHCKYPSTMQIGVVASKLVKQFPSLEDTLGTGYVSS